MISTLVPILWRYVAATYLKTFSLSVGTFVLVLLVSRSKEIARFTTLSHELPQLGLFIAYQIPFILPMAIPLSALISAFLLFQKISRNHELTALRAAGLSLKKVLAPIITASLFLTLLNFSICATLAPFCQRQAEKLLIEGTKSAPLLLIQKQQHLKTKDAFFTMQVQEDGKTATDFALATFNEGNKSLNLVLAKKLTLDQDTLYGQTVSVISHIPGKEDEFDSLIIESQDSLSMGTEALASMIKKIPPKTSASGQTFRTLLIGNDPQTLSEIFRRISFSLSVFTLTLLGIVFGIDPNRTPSKRNMLYLLALTLTALASYLLGKGLRQWPLYSALVYFAPHLIIWLSCWIQSNRLAKGVA